MRIGLITTYDTECGIAIYSEDLARALKGNGIEVTVFAEKVKMSLKGVKVPIPWQSQDSDLALLYEQIMETNIDILHLQYADGIFQYPEAVLELLRKLKTAGKTVVTTVHYAKSTEYIDKLADVSHVVIVHTMAALRYPAFRDNMAKHLGKFKLIPHGCDRMPIDIGINEARHKYGYHGRPVIGCHGFLHKYKNYSELLVGIKQLKNKYPQVLLIMLCSFHKELEISNNILNECHDLIRKLKIESNVKINTHFLARHEIVERLQACDVIVKPYGFGKNSIGVSGALLTIMLTQRPIVAKDAIPDVGKLIYPYSDGDLSQAVVEVFRKPDLYKRYKERVMVFIEDNSWDKVAKTHKNVYETAKALNIEGTEI